MPLEAKLQGFYVIVYTNHNLLPLHARHTVQRKATECSKQKIKNKQVNYRRSHCVTVSVTRVRFIGGLSFLIDRYYT